MKSFISFILVGFLGLSLITPDADARRLGGGKSFGRSAPSAQKAPAQQQAQPGATQSRQNQAANRTSGASRWLGPLAGLAAGGLLAALFFGDAFEGFQFMDFLLIIALVVGVMFILRSLRSKSSAPSMSRQAYAPAAPPVDHSNRFETPEIGSGLSGSPGSPAAEEYRPAWFNEEEFLRGAKSHFIRLQAAWDIADMKDIRDYTTPELFAELTLERQSYQGERQFTEVVSLDAELLSLAREDDHDRVVASVRYSGMIREDKNADPHAFSETWHVQRALDDANANWYVAGIEQQKQ